jgi:hypothetical protein
MNVISIKGFERIVARGFSFDLFTLKVPIHRHTLLSCLHVISSLEFR